MRITVNGEAREVAARHVAGLLRELDYNDAHVAVAINFDVVPRAQWANAALKAGDEVEILSPRQGG